MEYDKWTRKLVKVISEWGFQQGDRKATSHTKWTYTGAKTERSVTIIVPTHIDARRRAKTIANIKLNLRRAGAKADELAAFGRIALGLMQADSSDDFDDLEEKLAAALVSRNALEAARIALELGKRAGSSGKLNYKSTAIAEFETVHDQEIRKKKTLREIDALILKQLRIMMVEFFSSGEDFSVSLSDPFSQDGMTTVPTDICDKYGIRFDNCEADEYTTSISGVFYGPAESEFQKECGIIRFEATLNIDPEDGYACTEDINDFHSVRSRLPHDCSLEDLLRSRKALESIVTMQLLQGP